MLTEQRFRCSNCGHDASAEWGHEAGKGSGTWLCDEFAAVRFDCGCSLDFGLCPTHQPMVAGVLNAIRTRRLSQQTLRTIAILANRPAGDEEWTSWVRSAGPERIEAMAHLANLAAR